MTTWWDTNLTADTLSPSPLKSLLRWVACESDINSVWKHLPICLSLSSLIYFRISSNYLFNLHDGPLPSPWAIKTIAKRILVAIPEDNEKYTSLLFVSAQSLLSGRFGGNTERRKLTTSRFLPLFSIVKFEAFPFGKLLLLLLFYLSWYTYVTWIFCQMLPSHTWSSGDQTHGLYFDFKSCVSFHLQYICVIYKYIYIYIYEDWIWRLN